MERLKEPFSPTHFSQNHGKLVGTDSRFGLLIRLLKQSLKQKYTIFCKFFERQKMDYRGIEYRITKLKEEHWEWKYYPKKEQGSARTATLHGSQDDAITACMAAIDNFLDQTVR